MSSCERNDFLPLTDTVLIHRHRQTVRSHSYRDDIWFQYLMPWRFTDTVDFHRTSECLLLCDGLGLRIRTPHRSPLASSSAIVILLLIEMHRHYTGKYRTGPDTNIDDGMFPLFAIFNTIIVEKCRQNYQRAAATCDNNEWPSGETNRYSNVAAFRED